MNQNDFPEIADLEVVELRKKLREAEAKLVQYEAVLKESGLLEKAVTSPEEAICIAQIGKLKELSDKNIPFQTEDIKNLETLVKTLQVARGKAPVVEDKKKKQEKPDVAKLLAIAGDRKFERD